MAFVRVDTLHPQPTSSGRYRYLFTNKHRYPDSEHACWLPALTLEEEFAVFDLADSAVLSDDDGNLYGLGLRPDGSYSVLGTCGEQVAEFPSAHAGQPWHGYPVWHADERGRNAKKGLRSRPAREVFEKMQQAGVISQADRVRLYRGDDI